jgi:hypothetical protein
VVKGFGELIDPHAATARVLKPSCRRPRAKIVMYVLGGLTLLIGVLASRRVSSINVPLMRLQDTIARVGGASTHASSWRATTSWDGWAPASTSCSMPAM